ncbi:THUMP-like domain-containing protein [Rothia uropygialis]|uniref:THUMP-like domain-containing protein n=1 Tax=Kocuria sp. 36 TaxID=1415402 RepID=UPI00101C406C|nr:class I SAM-dependent methyltransferase [Kocuria sp. 36]
MTHLFTSEELNALDALEYREENALALSTALRKQGFPPDRASALLTQAKLRAQARLKFGQEAERMLFTRPGLEQATRASVAQWHARRFQRAGIDSVADLGCGIGSDSAAFLRAGLSVLSYEIDPDTASVARHNLSTHATSEVRTGDVTDVDTTTLRTVGGEPIRALWLDPARRETEQGRVSRLFDPEAFAPPFSQIERWASTGIAMGVKMGPGMEHADIPSNAEAEWVSCGGDVVELTLWFNGLARPGVRRSATVLDSDPLEPHVIAHFSSGSEFGHDVEGSLSEPRTGPPAAYLYEPDGAVIRAGLIDQLASAVEGHFLDPRIAYFTSEQGLNIPGATCWAVEESLPMGPKTLKKWVRDHGVTGLTIKKRGVDIVPETLRGQLLAGTKRGKKTSAGRHATLILTRWESQETEQRAAFVVRRMSQ